MTFKAQLVRLDEIALINPKRRVTKGTSVPFVEMAALPQNFRDINPSEVETRIAKGAGAHFQNGDTLLARITPCLENGKTAQVDCLEDDSVGEGSTEFIVLCGIDREDDDYVYYLCRDAEFRDYAIGRMEGTSGRQRVSWQSIAAYEFAFPPPSQRRAVAQILTELDDRISLLRETNSTLEAIAQALFKSWFVDFDPVRAKAEGKLPEGIDAATAALFPDAFDETELGQVPKGWEVKAIGEVVETLGGGTPNTKNPEYWNPPKHNWTTPKDLSNLSAPVLLQTERKLSEAGLEKVSSGLLPAGTLLMSSRAPIGYLAISHAPIAINQGYIAIPPNGRLSPLFMLFWCKVNMETIKARANGSTFMEISKKAFKPIPAIVPSVAVLDFFENIASSIFSRIFCNEEQIQSLTNLRDTLLPRLISGQLRIADAEAELEKATA